MSDVSVDEGQLLRSVVTSTRKSVMGTPTVAGQDHYQYRSTVVLTPVAFVGWLLASVRPSGALGFTAKAVLTPLATLEGSSDISVAPIPVIA